MVSEKQIQSQLTSQGLTSEEVILNRQKYGSNVLSPPKRDPWWLLFLEKFEDPVIRILMVAAVIAIAVGWFEGEYIEGLGIIVAILLATILAFINEYRANQAFEILNQYVDELKVRVIREGHVTAIPRKSLVVGDLVYVEQGEEIAADGEVVEAVSLLLDQSKITGETEPVQKFTQSELDQPPETETTYPNHKVYRSTIVAQGNGYFVVTAVGDQTEIGQLATAVATVENTNDTPLNQQLQRLSELIGVVGLSFAILIFTALFIRGFITGEFQLTGQQDYFLGIVIISVLFALIPVWLPVVDDGIGLIQPDLKFPHGLDGQGFGGWLKVLLGAVFLLGIGIALGYPLGWLPEAGETWLPTEVGTTLLQYFMVAVTIIVVAVPEGLPMSVTLSLAYSMKRMAKANNLVRRMHACETIGAATVICCDKTGTLTRNQMRVNEISFLGLHATKLVDLDFARNLIAEAMAANSTADLDGQPEQDPTVMGNATEGALLLWLEREKFNYLSFRHNFEIKFRMSFCPRRKYMATVGRSPVAQTDLLHLKGAPEVVVDKCTHILTEYGVLPLHNKEPILAALKAYQARGMRTLGFAYRELSENLMDLEVDEVGHYLTWLGFVAISDPLRTDVSQAIESCLDAGIQVKVVTGDGADTAQEIARQIGLWTNEESSPYACLTGQEFRNLPDEEAKEAVKSLKVLSRAVPLDKLRLVQLLQSVGEVVGATGDGTNDAAALKQARVGLAMGSGTAIAKEASDIILLDDSFKSIVNAVVWGRSLYENIQRFILFQLTINVVALGIALLGPFIGVSLPLTVTQMLWVNLIMDTFAALALATEPPHWAVLEQPPRSPNAFIISPTMTKIILGSGLIFLVFLVGFLKYLGHDGRIEDYELSVFFAVFVLLQFWNLFNARCLGLKQSAFQGLYQNKAFMGIAALILVGQILIIQFGREVFRTVPLSGADWLKIILGTSIVLWVGEAWRWFSRLKREHFSTQDSS
ncbi:calcium-translocating P-type ATPase, PMCA-type [Spirulina sp. CS-785/01]|uniref:calcium-translocating P-type ATPase, PMCA-type n=1 Tax=Spirulina sp. CS-785/01 TaxID=3021716 RepID=UPI00232C5636|nr:calcium-translocating P-type ATPase, PMCA-type [Spirulina sp. CS-785/01]MDB9313213.1 calcium-translocating P-type ATPase, PMCA-type [Spirulina sp. CS-785/01]